MSNINENAVTSLSQRLRIKKYLEDGNILTSLDALKLFDCFRLASSVSELRNEDGLSIQTVYATKVSNKKRICAYFIPDAVMAKYGKKDTEQAAYEMLCSNINR